MIRINLLPEKARPQASEGSQLWLAIILALLACEVVGALVLYSTKQEELSQVQKENARIQDRIKESKAQVKNHPEVKRRLEVLKAREEAIDKLQRARTGPASVLLELSRLLTKNRGPTISPEALSEIQRENPLSMMNENWDSRRLWLTSFVEQDRTVRLAGLARDGEDVSELARRMNLSGYFYDVKLLPAKREKDKKSAIEWVNFQLEARVRY